jgi:hypothetical protein
MPRYAIVVASFRDVSSLTASPLRPGGLPAHSPQTCRPVRRTALASTLTCNDLGRIRRGGSASGVTDRSLSGIKAPPILCLSCDSWWQVQGSNLGRLSRRFYIPEEAGRGQVAKVPVFVPFPAGLWACREEGRGPGGAPGWTNDLEAGPPPGSHWVKAGNGYAGCGGACPVCSRVRGRRGCVHPFGGARGWGPRGHGAGSRAGSGINQTSRPPAGGGGQ